MAILAEKNVYRIFDLKANLASRTDAASRAEYKLLKDAERLYLKAARAVNNARLIRLLTAARDEEDNETSGFTNTEFKQSSKRNNTPIDNYTEEEYNNFGWARENDILTASENSCLRSIFADAVTGRAKPPKTPTGEYMIAVGDKAENRIAFIKGDISSPIITRILEINEYDETILSELRRETYAIERRGIQQEAGGLFNTYTATSFGGSLLNERSRTQSQRYNNRFGTDRGAGSGKALRNKAIIFDKRVGNNSERE